MNKNYNIQIFNSSNSNFLPIKKSITHIEKVLKSEKIHQANINVVYVDKEEILSLNKEFLNHDYYTDVITFSLIEESGREIDAEIYICVDVAIEQAEEYKVSLTNELLRLCIHGTLHLCGYNDKTEEQSKKMRQLENRYLGKN